MVRTRRRIRHTKSRRQQRRRIGGGDKERSDFLATRHSHIDISRIGPLKPVATPLTTGVRVVDGVRMDEDDITRCIRRWTALSPEDIKDIQRRTKKGIGFTLNAHIYPAGPDTANRIIFYAEEYLAVLSSVSGIPVEEILHNIATMGKKTEQELAIIHVAFGDDHSIMSERGMLLKMSYLSRLRELTSVL
jgi:hypothetical protein